MVDLVAGTASGGDGRDRVIGIEGVSASNHADRIIETEQENRRPRGERRRDRRGWPRPALRRRRQRQPSRRRRCRGIADAGIGRVRYSG